MAIKRLWTQSRTVRTQGESRSSEATGASRAIVARATTLYGCGGGRRCRFGPVAQRLEPTAHNGLVGGSSPPGPTMILLNALTFGAALSFADYRNDRARAIGPSRKTSGARACITP